MWNKIKAPFVWIADKWHKFEFWVASIAPGLKTKIISALGVIGSASALCQEWVTGIPLSQLIGTTEALIVTTVLFSLTYWFRRLADK